MLTLSSSKLIITNSLANKNNLEEELIHLPSPLQKL